MVPSKFVQSLNDVCLNNSYINAIVHDYRELAEVRTTLGVYGHLYLKGDVEAAKRLEGLLDVSPE